MQTKLPHRIIVALIGTVLATAFHTPPSICCASTSIVRRTSGPPALICVQRYHSDRTIRPKPPCAPQSAVLRSCATPASAMT